LLLVLLLVPRARARLDSRKGTKSRLNILARHLTGENFAHEHQVARPADDNGCYQQVQTVLEPDAPVTSGRAGVVEAGVLGPQEA
jgi:hypothetical protein